MDKFIITVLGKDRPGIVAAVSKSLYHMECNIQNINQMILQNEFAGFFIIEHPVHLDMVGIPPQHLPCSMMPSKKGEPLQVPMWGA